MIKLYFFETLPLSKSFEIQVEGVLSNYSQLAMFSYMQVLSTTAFPYGNKCCGLSTISLSLDFVILNPILYLFVCFMAGKKRLDCR